ncbi:YidH family protein [Aeromicrobium chenweiae]|uniref:Uncharacterized protein n=1 Tax=Aeromicrobium chenweiae TaxID=2079793 RepID=A0A2S0WLH9_9ACTN|nr:DUF202 domain-containing protein [Aeromicrobium chenweiae]AWB92176.1 hypothetical protein C3E78_08170 [Aeromicrobium chenweiae]TGN31539.1 DUF202 domain-containing protein [Aeromicrobium chenweiae]
MRERRHRRPHWVYGQGDDPDYSSSLANERTFLTWVRTALALLAAGVALDVVDLSISSQQQKAIAMTLLILAVVTALVSWVRWGLVERSMRRREPMPPIGFGALLVLALVGISAILIIAWL